MDPKSRLFAYSILSRVSQFAGLPWKSPKISKLVREYCRFAETIGGDLVRPLPPDGIRFARRQGFESLLISRQRIASDGRKVRKIVDAAAMGKSSRGKQCWLDPGLIQELF
jgi:hypothetical protein